MSLGTASKREHARKIAENPETVTVTRRAMQRAGLGKEAVEASYTMTARLYLQSQSLPNVIVAALGEVKRSRSYSLIAPLLDDDGAPLFADADLSPNNPNVEHTFEHPLAGLLEIDHVYPLTVDETHIGFYAELSERA